MPHAKWARNGSRWRRTRPDAFNTKYLDSASIWRAIIYHPVDAESLTHSTVAHQTWLMTVAPDPH